ncbi:sodium-dependent high-affinity dicarboxylate transporter 3-like [Pieris rapae]|uniref:sodium-dependent high-affinity dicarboxylate transporter 3-like n=1 Tax=Pieris rapae TaxID=64459 RepID=UPI001E27E70E|nr:sodium-dependent high-affinity dicarboxylate transporter 3-like [Pieris rapae]
MGILASVFGPKDPRTPVRGPLPRVKNLFTRHFRGIIGVLVPLFALSWQPVKGQNDITVMCMWFMMFWFLIWQPVSVPVVGLIPLFLLPMTGVMSSPDVCSSYFNDSICLFILSGMILLLLNMSGFDRRFVLWLLCSGDNCQFSGKRIVFKSSVAAFVMSMFSNRLIASSAIIQYLTPAYINLQSYTSRYRATEPNYDAMRHIVLNAVQTSSSIGSTAILHSSYTILAMRAMFSEQDKKLVFPDIFNYLQYTVFAFPTAFFMFILNVCYHMLLINWRIGKPMSASSMTEFRNSILKNKSSLPKKSTRHENLTVLFALLYLITVMFRWSRWTGASWAKNKTLPNNENLPMIKDASVAAIFLMLIHVVPRTCGWMKILQAEKKSECGSLKPDSALMFWRFVDKNTNYGYIILIGSGVALARAIKVANGYPKCFNFYENLMDTKAYWNNQMALISVVAAIGPNIMSGVGSLISFLPLILSVRGEGEDESPWKQNRYAAVLAAGMGSSFGFMLPFLYTPAYFCHFTGKVPIKKMILYSIGSLIICTIVLWAATCFWAPIVWQPPAEGFEGVVVVEGGDAGGGDAGGGGDEGGGDEPEP